MSTVLVKKSSSELVFMSRFLDNIKKIERKIGSSGLDKTANYLNNLPRILLSKLSTLETRKTPLMMTNFTILRVCNLCFANKNADIKS